MVRFEQKNSPALSAGVWGSMTAVYAADFYAPLGVAVFIGYMVPMALSMFSWKVRMPLLTALVASVLIIVDQIMTPEGTITWLAHLNRSFGIVTIWMLAGIGFQFIRTRLKVRRQEWLQKSQADLNTKLLGDQKVEELGENILNYLCTHLDAQAGAIFIEDSGFRKVATFAAPAGSVPERFEVGEGLLGQCARDGRAYVLRDVPPGYLAVGSSLGQSSPASMLIAPMMADGATNAVIELGFFHPVYEADAELLRLIGNAVGLSLRSAKYRMRLQLLLEETQQQSEEIQAQNEEVRVANEELEEQGRSLRESQARLELQQVEMEQTNSQLEEQTQILESQKTELIRAKMVLEDQAHIVEQASRYKSDFLANMSHELRTPLNSSLILAKLLADNREGNLTPEQVKFATTIQSAGNDLLVLINDVLDLSKIEAGHMEIHPEEVSLEHLVSGLRSIFEPVAAQKGLSLQTELAPGVPEKLVTDAQRLEQVLKNLLSNALKFTEKGNVTLRVIRDAEGRVAFAVQDTGIGIAVDHQKFIFDPFAQADGTTSRKFGGTGLGLSISRQLARLLGAEITLSSEVGKGSVFTLTVPEVLAESSAPAERGHMAVDQFISTAPPAVAPTVRPATPVPVQQLPDDREVLAAGRRVILTVEDDPSFAEIVADLAHEMGFQSLIATTAEEALALAVQHSPSAVVLDVGLPDNSGLFVLERLKADSRTRHIPVHVVSGSDYTQKALSLGAVGYMLKPVKREQLMDAFRSLETRLTQKMRSVLVVEDDPVQVEAMQKLLGSREVTTVGVRSVAECLKKLRTNTFDCMVLDLSLPDASGFSLLETLSTEDSYAFPPVIVYTGRALTADEEQRLRRYSKSIIIKGAKSPERLLDEVTLFLHQVVSDLPPEKQQMLERSGNRDSALEGRRILIAEDDVRNIYALTSLLEGRGVKLQIARNGKEAVEALEQSLHAPLPPIDLVLMDIMMPEMDGITAMKVIRKRSEWKKLPIIALTAKAMKDDQMQCLEAGANDYLAKPLDVEKLLSLIRVWMPR